MINKESFRRSSKYISIYIYLYISIYIYLYISIYINIYHKYMNKTGSDDDAGDNDLGAYCACVTNSPGTEFRHFIPGMIRLSGIRSPYMNAITDEAGNSFRKKS